MRIPSSGHPAPLPAGTLVGKWEVVQPLSASGGVYLVARAGRRWGLKFPLAASKLSPSEKRAAEQRIIRELTPIQTVRHPGVVRIHSFGRSPDAKTGALFLSMDLVDGTPLLDWVRTARPAPVELMRVFRDMALALQALHEAGIVHRHLRSRHVLVGGAAGAWQPVLLDFGLALPALARGVSREEVLASADGHWAPELLGSQGAPAKHSQGSDLFALGHLFYEAVTGQAPFGGEDHAALIDAVLEDAPRPPGQLARDLPAGLEPLLLKLLAKKPRDRVPTAPALVSELDVLLRAAQPVVPAPPAPAAVPVVEFDAEVSPEPKDRAPAPHPLRTRLGRVQRALRRLVASSAARQLPRWMAQGSVLVVGAAIIHAVAMAAIRSDGSLSPFPLPPPADSENRSGDSDGGATSACPPPQLAMVPPGARARRAAGAMVHGLVSGQVRDGPVTLQLNQPVSLGRLWFPPGWRLDGDAEQEWDGRYRLRFKRLTAADGSSVRVAGQAVLPEAAGRSPPSGEGDRPPAFTLDFVLTLAGDSGRGTQ